MYDYQGLIEALQHDWAEFHSLVPTYRKYVEVMKRLKKENRSCKNLRVYKISESFLRDEFPKNSFLSLPTLEEAINYLYDCTPEQLTILSKVVSREKSEVFYTRLSNWIRSANYRIKNAGRPKVYHYNIDNEVQRKEAMENIASSISSSI